MADKELTALLRSHLRLMASDNTDNRESAVNFDDDYAIGVCDGYNKAVEEIDRLLQTLASTSYVPGPPVSASA